MSGVGNRFLGISNSTMGPSAWWNTGNKNITPPYLHENSAFKNSIHACLMLNSENISYILCTISHLPQSITIKQHVSAQIAMPKRTISHRMLLFVHYPLLKSHHFRVYNPPIGILQNGIPENRDGQTLSVVGPLGRDVAGLSI